MRPTQIREGNLLPIQMLISSKLTLRDTPRIMFYQVSGHPKAQSSWHIKLTILPRLFHMVICRSLKSSKSRICKAFWRSSSKFAHDFCCVLLVKASPVPAQIQWVGKWAPPFDWRSWKIFWSFLQSPMCSHCCLHFYIMIALIFIHTTAYW